MRRLWLLLFVPAIVAVACNASRGETAPSGPYGVECRFAHRTYTDVDSGGPPSEPGRVSVTLRTDETERVSIFPGTEVSASMAPAADDPSISVLTIHAPAARTTREFRLVRDRAPTGQAVALDGFAGRNSLAVPGMDLGFMCLVDPERSRADDPPVVRTGPFQVRCDVTSNGETHSELFDAERVATVDSGTAQVVIHLVSNLWDGRSFFYRLMAEGHSFQALFQHDFTNKGGGPYGLGGRATLHADAGDVSVGCTGL